MYRKKFFISSTFKDCHGERDLLKFDVIPAFREEARAHGDEVDSVDLRWGLNNFGLSGAEAEGKVLRVCLEEIDNSRPYMIIFLGGRFGWVPPIDRITDDFARKFNPDADKSVDETRGRIAGRSVTALEIEYGLDKNSKSIICIREEIHGDIPADQRKIYYDTEKAAAAALKALKDNLAKSHADSIIRYTADFDGGGLTNFRTLDGRPLKEAILEKMLAYCAEDWRKFKNLPWQSRELTAADNFAESRAGLFVERKALVAEVEDNLERWTGVFVRGEAGCGKTSLACKVAKDFGAKGWRVCNIFCGTSPMTSSAHSILQLMIYFLEPTYNSDGVAFEDLKRHLTALCRNVSEPTCFIVDAIDQLDNDEHRSNLDFLPIYGENVHTLVTFATDSAVPAVAALTDMPAALQKKIANLSDAEIIEHWRQNSELFESLVSFFRGERTAMAELLSDGELVTEMVKSLRERAGVAPNFEKFQLVEIPALKSDESISILEAMLKRSGRELYEETASAVLVKDFSSPLQLEMAAQMLNMIAAPELTSLPSPQDIIPLTVKFIGKIPDEPSAAARHIIEEAMARLPILVPEKVIEALNLLAVSRGGLRLSDLQAVMENSLNAADWALVQKYLYGFFVERQNAQIDFAHKTIRAGIREKIDDTDLKRIERRLVAHAAKLPAGDVIRNTEGIHLAHKLHKISFAAELYVEAEQTKNSILLHAIHEAFVEDDGAFGIDFILNYLGNLDSEKINPIVSFFTTTFQRMMNGGQREYAIALNIFNAISVADGNFNSYMNLQMAMQKIRLGLYEDATPLLLRIIYLDTGRVDSENDLNFCRLMAESYKLLATVIAKHNARLLHRYSSKYSEWAERAWNISHSDEDALNLEEARHVEVLRKYLLKPVPLEEMLAEALEIHSRILPLFPTEPTNTTKLQTLVTVDSEILRLYLELNRAEEALPFAREAEPYARTLLVTDANNPESTMLVAVFMARISLIESAAGNLARSKTYAEESRNLSFHTYAFNPMEKVHEVLMSAVNELG